MTTATEAEPRLATARADNPAYQAYWGLRIAFTVAPILFGLDKFFQVMVDWDKYLAGPVDDVIPGNAHTAMLVVGGIEVAAGLVTAVLPRLGGYLVATWLLVIVANLLIKAEYYDIALRDFGLSLGALSLTRLATGFRGSRGLPEHRLNRPRAGFGSARPQARKQNVEAQWSERMARLPHQDSLGGGRSA